MEKELVRDRLFILTVRLQPRDIKRISSSLILLITILFVSCVSSNRETEEDNLRVESWKKGLRDGMYANLSKAINSGDCEAYKSASEYYFADDNWQEFFYYAFFMTKKYNCAYAHYDIYYFMNEELTINNVELSLDDGLRKEAIYHLLQAYYLNKELASEEIKEVFKNRNVPTLEEYKKIVDNGTKKISK